VLGDESRIGLSMSLVSLVANPIAAWLLWRAWRHSRG